MSIHCRYVRFLELYEGGDSVGRNRAAEGPMAEAYRIGPLGKGLNGAGDEFGVAVHTEFFFIRADIFFFLRDTDAHGRLEDVPDDGAGDKSEEPNHDDAYDLGTQGATFLEETDSQRAPDSSHQVDRESTDRVINLQFVKERHREND